MKPLLLTSLLLATTFAACGSMSTDAANNTANAAAATKSFDVNKLLGGISDKPTAEAAKGPLEAVVAQLKGLMGGASNPAAGGAADASTGMKKLSTDVLAKFGISGDTVGMITGLLGNPAVSGAIGPVLNQLKGLIGA